MVLLSGGLDSAVVACRAAAEGLVVHALTFRYGQRHEHEIDAARRIAKSLGVDRHLVLDLDPAPMANSALTGGGNVPKGRNESEMASGVPSTYVPARNLIFLSMAGAYAQSVGADSIHIGVNAIDYSGYPDCRPAFIESFQRTLRLALPAADPDHGIEICAPILDLTKAQIIQLGHELGVEFSLTHSCYDPDAHGRACGECDACILRRHGFAKAGVADPTRYAVRAPA